MLRVLQIAHRAVQARIRPLHQRREPMDAQLQPAVVPQQKDGHRYGWQREEDQVGQEE